MDFSVNFPPLEELSLPTVWEPSNDDLAFAEDEALDVGQWQDYSDQKYRDGDIDTTMEIDSQPGSEILDQVFGTSCESPTGPLEEFNNIMLLDKDQREHFMAPLLLLDGTTDELEITPEDSTIALSWEERYKATLEKLAASMKRSQETRNCLTIKTVKTEKYERLESVKQIVSAIASSSNQVQNYVTSVQ